MRRRCPRASRRCAALEGPSPLLLSCRPSGKMRTPISSIPQGVPLSSSSMAAHPIELVPIIETEPIFCLILHFGHDERSG